MQTSELLLENNGFQSLSSDFEVGLDPASSTIFCSDYQRNDDIKKMLDSNKDFLKLTAMRRVIAMVARGKECSELFPAVVKNVVSKNPEIKKLVYVYLTRFAEEQQDLALLSISTFQRSLKDSNQLIRASALRVLSSIRIPVIVPILMLGLRDGAADLSPYVRKAVAHAVPKLYSLEPEEKESLVEIISKLLNDKSTVVVGSAVHAFEEVCPERIDLIHKHYRKLCNLVMDVDEWGQIAIINMLTRYARTQFPDPKVFLDSAAVASDNSCPKSVISNEDREKEEEESLKLERHTELNGDSSKGLSEDALSPAANAMLRADYHLLVTVSRLLLLSHNAAVVVAVVQLFYHCGALKEEMPSAVRALMRVLRSTKEIQYVVLSNVASMSLLHPSLFEPYLSMFFVFNSDPIQIKLLKLEILTNLVNTATSSAILREFQAYVDSASQEFVLATVQCIGRAASILPQIAETCLTGLLRLMSRKNGSLVAESVVVMRKLLQIQTADHKDVIAHIAQMVEEITIPSARASILWLLGEHCHRVPKIAPDVLRKMAISFPKERVPVKLQILNLAAKLCIVNPKQTLLIGQYVFTLAKYDLNYDIRDRSRILRAFIFPKAIESTANSELSFLARNAKKILLAAKPAPILRSTFADRPSFRLGSMSQLLGRQLAKYKELPEWPLIPPDPSSRSVNLPPPLSPTGVSSNHSGQSLSISQQETEDEESIEEEEEEEDGDEEVFSESEEEDVEGDRNAVENDDELNEYRNELDNASLVPKSDLEPRLPPLNRAASFASLSTESSLQTDDADDDDEVDNEKEEYISANQKAAKGRTISEAEKSEDFLLLDFNSPPIPTVGQDRLPSLDGPVLPLVVAFQSDRTCPPGDTLPPNESAIQINIPSYEMPRPTWFSCTSAYAEPLSVEARFTRTVSVFGPRQTCLELRLTNHSVAPRRRLYRLRPDTSRPTEKSAHCVELFTEIESLEVDESAIVFIGVDFRNSTQPLRFSVRYHLHPLEEKQQDEVLNVEINPPIGELFQPLDISVREFVLKQSSLRGMHETTKSFACATENADLVLLVKRLLQRANLGLVGAFNRDAVLESGADVFSTTDVTCNSATRILRLAGVTAGGGGGGGGGGEEEATCCLVEVALTSAPDASVTVRVHTEAIVLGLQLVDELADCVSRCCDV